MHTHPSIFEQVDILLGRPDLNNELFKLLESCSSRDNYQTEYGEFLRQAINANRKDVVEWLLCNKADITIKFGDWTAMEYLARDSRWDYIELFLEHCDLSNDHATRAGSVLLYAVKAKRWDVAIKLLQKGASPNWQQFEAGCSTLTWAILRNKLDFVMLLMQAYQANPNQRNNNLSPYERALKAGNKKAIDILAQTIPPDVETLVYAAKNNHWDFVYRFMHDFTSDPLQHPGKSFAKILYYAQTQPSARVEEMTACLNKHRKIPPPIDTTPMSENEKAAVFACQYTRESIQGGSTQLENYFQPEKLEELTDRVEDIRSIVKELKLPSNEPWMARSLR